MAKSIEIPDCYYPKEAVLVSPSGDTPKRSLYLSNIDTQHSLRPNTLRYVFLYKRPLDVPTLKASLSKVLVDYYPLAGRLIPAGEDAQKLEIDCNQEGALFAQGFLDLTAAEFLEASRAPNYTWMKLLYKGLHDPPLVIQVLHLTCGSTILCMAISHCICDGVGSAQFLRAWARIAAYPDANLSVAPFHDRTILRPRTPPCVDFSHPEYCIPQSDEPKAFSAAKNEPLVPIILTFSSNQIHRIKKLHCPSGKCTTFEALASHIWCAWVRSLDLPPSHLVRLGFSINIRRRLNPELPQGYYGNGFVLGCIETIADHIATPGANRCVELIQQVKERITDGYVRSVIDLLEDNRVRLNTSSSMVSLIISQWSKLGLEEIDFGEGRPIYVGPQYPPLSHRVCLLLPVIGDPGAVTMWMSFPQGMVDKFRNYLEELGNGEDEGS